MRPNHFKLSRVYKVEGARVMDSPRLSYKTRDFNKVHYYYYYYYFYYSHRVLRFQISSKSWL